MFRKITQEEYLELSKNSTIGSAWFFQGCFGKNYPRFYFAQNQIWIAQTPEDDIPENMKEYREAEKKDFDEFMKGLK